jgi:anti-sigma regulatory factor (Ser/Thr protein kinase)
MTASDSLALDLPAVPTSVAEARRAVARFIAALDVDHDGIALAVSEAVSNAVLHAYRQHDEPGRVELRAELVDERLRIVVRDDGMGLVPRIDSPGAGLGLPLIAQLAVHVDVESAAGTTILMEFARGAAGQPRP